MFLVSQALELFSDWCCKILQAQAAGTSESEDEIWG